MPSTRNEDYRFTDISPLLRTHVQVSYTNSRTPSVPPPIQYPIYGLEVPFPFFTHHSQLDTHHQRTLPCTHLAATDSSVNPMKWTRSPSFLHYTPCLT